MLTYFIGAGITLFLLALLVFLFLDNLDKQGKLTDQEPLVFGVFFGTLFWPVALIVLSSFLVFYLIKESQDKENK